MATFLDDTNLSGQKTRGRKMSGQAYSDDEQRRFQGSDRPVLPSTPEAMAALEAYTAGHPDDTNEFRVGAPTGMAQTATTSAGSPTVLHGAEAGRIGIGAQDAATLAALGPEYAAEGQRLLNDPSAKRQAITGRNETTGQSFVMPVGNRVSRQSLIPGINRIAQAQLEAKMKAAQGDQFNQQQAMARIPGQNAVDLSKQQGANKVTAINAEGAVQAPTRDANVRKSNQESANLAGAESRAQRQFDEANDPASKQRAAADQALKILSESGAQNTPEGRQTLAAIAALSSIGSRLPGKAGQSFTQAASQPNPEAQFDAQSAIMNDPQVAKAIEAIKANKQGWFHSGQRQDKTTAVVKNLQSYVQRYARAKGLDPDETWAQIYQQVQAER